MLNYNEFILENENNTFSKYFKLFYQEISTLLNRRYRVKIDEWWSFSTSKELEDFTQQEYENHDSQNSFMEKMKSLENFQRHRPGDRIYFIYVDLYRNSVNDPIGIVLNFENLEVSDPFNSDIEVNLPLCETWDDFVTRCVSEAFDKTVSEIPERIVKSIKLGKKFGI